MVFNHKSEEKMAREDFHKIAKFFMSGKDVGELIDDFNEYFDSYYIDIKNAKTHEDLILEFTDDGENRPITFFRRDINE